MQISQHTQSRISRVCGITVLLDLAIYVGGFITGLMPDRFILWGGLLCALILAIAAVTDIQVRLAVRAGVRGRHE